MLEKHEFSVYTEAIADDCMQPLAILPANCPAFCSGNLAVDDGKRVPVMMAASLEFAVAVFADSLG